MEWLGETFISSDIDGAERQIVADQPVVVFRPKRQQKGMTFVVTAANIPLSKYTSIIKALTSSDRVVVGFFINALKPLIGNHRAKAEKIREIFLELKDEFRVTQYDIVGHSIGGKISLLTASLYDEDNYIRNIIALDPVDQSPVEFTRHHNTSTTPQDKGGENNTKRKRGRTNLSLTESKADITLTFTDTGYFIDKKHNAREIQANNPNVKLVLHRSSCHMVYCDEGGLISWKAMMGNGSSTDRNKKVKEDTIALIKERAIRPSMTGNTTGKASSMIKSNVSKAKAAVNNSQADCKKMKGEAKKKSSMFKGVSKVLG